MHVNLLNNKFFKAYGSFVLNLDLEKFRKRQYCPHLSQDYSRPKRSLWPRGLVEKTSYVATSMPHRLSTSAYLQKEVCMLFTVLMAAPVCFKTTTKQCKMKFCNDAGIIVSTFFKSFNPHPQGTIVWWAEVVFFTTFLFREKCFKFQNSFCCSLKEPHSFLFCFAEAKK